MKNNQKPFSLSEKILIALLVFLAMLFAGERIYSMNLAKTIEGVSLNVESVSSDEFVLVRNNQSQSNDASKETDVLQANDDKKTIETKAINSSNLININTASESRLCSLNGIGEKKAAAIVDYVKQNGRFRSIEEIMNVSGIGEKTFENIKDYICVSS